jgi:hypothetical protein
MPGSHQRRSIRLKGYDYAPTGSGRGAYGVGATRRVAPTGSAPGSVGAIIAQFKSIAIKRIRQRLNAPGLAVWQRNYHEHVIRNEGSLDRIRRYIADNPARWALDRENPQASAPEPEDPWQA